MPPSRSAHTASPGSTRRVEGSGQGLHTASPGLAGTTTSDGLGASSLPSQIAELLEEAIIVGELLPGQRLRGDELAATYGVSRIPVREAMRTLEAGGWIEIRPRYGAYIRQHSAVELTELFEVRAVGEAYAARCAAVRRDDAELDRLRQIVTDNKHAARRRDVASLAPLSARFFDVLHQAAHNSVLEVTLSTLAKRARFYYATVAGQLGPDWAAVHERILDAVADQDADVAGTLVRKHIEHTGHAVTDLLGLSDS